MPGIYPRSAMRSWSRRPRFFGSPNSIRSRDCSIARCASRRIAPVAASREPRCRRARSRRRRSPRGARRRRASRSTFVAAKPVSALINALRADAVRRLHERRLDPRVHRAGFHLDHRRAHLVGLHEREAAPVEPRELPHRAGEPAARAPDDAVGEATALGEILVALEGAVDPRRGSPSHCRSRCATR